MGVSGFIRVLHTVDIRDCTMETQLGKMFKHYNVVLLSSFMMNTAYKTKY